MKDGQIAAPAAAANVTDRLGATSTQRPLSNKPAHECLVSTRILMPHARRVRTPLDRWVAELGAMLVGLRSKRSLQFSEVANAIEVGNNAALVEAHFGRLDVAREICDAQLCWLADISDSQQSPGLRVLALQPSINLARLDSLVGNTELALEHLRLLLGCIPGQPITIGPVTIDPDDWGLANRDMEWRTTFLYTVYVIESIKALITSHDYSGLLAFSSACDLGGVATLRPFLFEAAIIAHCHLGECDTALSAADKYRRLERSWEGMVYQLRFAEVAASCGLLQQASSTLKMIGEVLRRFQAGSKPSLAELLIAHRVAQLLCMLNEHVESRNIALAVLRDAREIGDEVLVIESLTSLSQLTCDMPSNVEWQQQLVRLRAQTWYRRFRTGSPDQSALQMLDGLRGALIDFMT